jgi:hypothetical protein
LAFPYAAQVFRLDREVFSVRNGTTSFELVFGITSLNQRAATPQRLLVLNRGHWTIENSCHYVRDVTFSEDLCRTRRGSGGEVLAAFRNVAINALRFAHETCIARGIRQCMWKSQYPLRMLGLRSVTV